MSDKESIYGLSPDGLPSDNNTVWQTRKEVILTVFGIVLLFTLGLAIANGVNALMIGEISKASDYASFASGLATMVLVGVTGWYTYVTRELVAESRKTRLDERKRKEEEKQRELNSLRRALLHEIDAIDNFEGMKGEPGIAMIRKGIPTQVYQGNTDNIGKLSSKEILLIIEYYTTLSNLNDTVYSLREGNMSWDDSEEMVNTIIKDLIESRNDAVDILEQKLDLIDKD